MHVHDSKAVSMKPNITFDPLSLLHLHYCWRKATLQSVACVVISSTTSLCNETEIYVGILKMFSTPSWEVILLTVVEGKRKWADGAWILHDIWPRDWLA